MNNTLDTVILIACGVLVVGLSLLLVWWLKVGKSHFIAKRCPERLKKTEDEVGSDGNGESDSER